MSALKVGSLVWQQMWSPMAEHAPKTVPYGHRRLMQLAGSVPDYGAPGITRWWLVDPERPNDESRMSYVESDWCDLEPHEDPDGTQLDLLDLINELSA